MAEEFLNTTPLPEDVDAQVLMDFPNAMREIINEKEITRLEWGDNDIYCLLKDSLLMIHINGDFKIWSINDGDLLATDWVVI